MEKEYSLKYIVYYYSELKMISFLLYSDPKDIEIKNLYYKKDLGKVAAKFTFPLKIDDITMGSNR